jgi:uncharacterized delta-60 repeat protein
MPVSGFIHAMTHALERRGLSAVAVSVSLALLAIPAVAVAAPGDLDGSFSTDGRATGVPQSFTFGKSMVQSDGSIIVSGSVGDSPELTRYQPDGTIDPTFGSGGTATYSADEVPQPLDLVALPSDKILVLGEVRESGTPLLARLNPDGTLDSSFAGGGTTTIEPDTPGQLGPSAVAVDESGRILVQGYVSRFDSNPHFAVSVTRLLSNGQPDPSFAGDGSTEYPVPAVGYDGGIAATPGGAVFAAFGDSGIGGNAGLSVLKLTPSGTPDAGFGSGGVATALVGSFDTASALALDPAGRPIALGQQCHFIHDGTACGGTLVARFTLAGQPDQSFAGDGTLSLTNPQNQFAAATDAAGRLVVAGDGLSSSKPVEQDMSIVRISPDGTLDRSFSGDGTVFVDFGEVEGSRDWLRDMSIAPDGRIVAVGETDSTGSLTDAIARLEVADGPPDADADGILDPQDACPHRYAMRANGCAALADTVHLRAAKSVLRGRVISDISNCVVGRAVVVKRAAKGGPAKAVGRLLTDKRGRFALRDAGSGRYFVKARPEIEDETGECAGAISGSVLVKSRTDEKTE